MLTVPFTDGYLIFIQLDFNENTSPNPSAHLLDIDRNVHGTKLSTGRTNQIRLSLGFFYTAASPIGVFLVHSWTAKNTQIENAITVLGRGTTCQGFYRPQTKVVNGIKHRSCQREHEGPSTQTISQIARSRHNVGAPCRSYNKFSFKD